MNLRAGSGRPKALRFDAPEAQNSYVACLDLRAIAGIREDHTLE